MSDAPETVAVTGIGLFAKAGNREDVFSAMDEGESSWEMISLKDADGFPPFAGVSAPMPSVRAYLPDPKMGKFMSQTSAMAVAAAGEAVFIAPVALLEEAL